MDKMPFFGLLGWIIIGGIGLLLYLGYVGVVLFTFTAWLWGEVVEGPKIRERVRKQQAEFVQSAAKVVRALDLAFVENMEGYASCGAVPLVPGHRADDFLLDKEGSPLRGIPYSIPVGGGGKVIQVDPMAWLRSEPH